MNCPFCNSVLPTLSTPAAADKLPCPRCGEPVPAARWSIGEPPLRPQPPSALPGKRKTALVVMGVMLTMAIVGLTFALWTTKQRQARHPWMPEKQEAIAFRQPSQLSGLGYLPKETQIVVGLQIAECLEDKAGKLLLDEPRPALLDFVLHQVTRSTNLKLEQIDHVVLGSALDAQLVLIVNTRQPYSLQKIAEAVQPAKASQHQNKPLYEFALKPLGETMLWCVEDRTLLFVMRLDTPKREHLSGLSVAPRSIDEVLSASLQKTMDERLAKRNLLWAVGRLDQLGAVKDWLPFVLGGKADLGPVKEMKTFALGLEPVGGQTLTGNFQMNDTNAAAKLSAMLDSLKIDGATSQKTEATPADAKEAWVTWQVRGDAAAMRQMLDRGKQKK